MGFQTGRRGPHNPLVGSRLLTEGWQRWTYIADSSAPNGISNPPVHMTAQARAVLATADELRDIGSASAVIDTDGMGRGITRAEALDHGRPIPLEALVGKNAGGGFRNALAATTTDASIALSPLATFLLDDAPGITLVAGYAEQWHDSATGTEMLSEMMTITDAAIDFQADICAGWAEEATLIQTLRVGRELLTPVGPDAPELWQDPVAEGWPSPKVMPTDSTRRVRRIDLGPTDTNAVRPFETHFRDSHVDEHGTHRVLHEYFVTGTITDGVITDLHATAQVLPWQECPGAVASAQRAVGARVDDLRALVRSDFRGTSTCTHLNDTVRSLTSLAAMAHHHP